MLPENLQPLYGVRHAKMLLRNGNLSVPTLLRQFLIETFLLARIYSNLAHTDYIWHLISIIILYYIIYVFTNNLNRETAMLFCTGTCTGTGRLACVRDAE